MVGLSGELSRGGLIDVYTSEMEAELDALKSSGLDDIDFDAYTTTVSFVSLSDFQIVHICKLRV